MSWKTTRVLNNLTYMNKQSKILFIQLDDIEYIYDDEIEIKFLKYIQDGDINIINDLFTMNEPRKIMIEINIFYTYYNADFAPRYELNIYKNNILLNKHYCGLNDTVETINNLYLVSVVDISNNDKIKIIMIKDNLENSTSKINILKNSFINYKTF